jgi:hypothetical protein
MADFFAFRTMIAATFIRVIFAVGLVGIVLTSIGAIANDQAIAGLLVLVFGALYWRVVCELFIVFFRMNDTLTAIKSDTASLPSQSTTPSAPPPAAPPLVEPA